MDLEAELQAALLAALAVPDERDLAAMRRRALEAPGAPPESAEGLGGALRERLARLRERGEAAAERRRCGLLGLELLPWTSTRYPAQLLDLAGPPPALYLRGSGAWPPRQPLTIVGARASTARGRAFARELGAGVAARGGSVVSGLAVGIDQAALEGALEGEGPAYAVLACGVDRIYPPGAAPLARRVEAAGRILGELPLGTPPYKAHFPRRNRILAALSRATLVVEADLRSGSLVTAHRALDLGRTVCAVPGAIDAPASRGTNRLIRDGGHPLLAVEDLDLLLDATKGRRRPQRDTDHLLRALAAPIAVDELSRRAGVPLDLLLLRLVELEADGRVARLGGGLYVRA
jgi:DNA processing protein